MASPFYEPEDLPAQVPNAQGVDARNAFLELQNSLRRQVLPAAVEQELPDAPMLSPATAGEQHVGISKLLIGGILRQKLGVDIFANSRAQAARDAAAAYASQTANLVPVSLDAVAQQIEDPAEREAYQRRVGALTPLERKILEAANPTVYAALPAETLKLVAPGSTDPTDTALQTYQRLGRMRDEAARIGDEALAQGIAAKMTQVMDTIGVETVALSPGGILVNKFTGKGIAEGNPPATSADNFITPDGIKPAIPGTQQYFEFVAAGYPKDRTQQITQIGAVDKTVERDYQKEALKARLARERLVPIRAKVMSYNEIVRPFARFGTRVASFKDAFNLASDAEKEQLRTATALASDTKYEFALLVQNLTGAAASENQIKDYTYIIDNWETYSPTKLSEVVSSAMVRIERQLSMRFVYDELRKEDEGLAKVAPWELSNERATSYFRGAVAAGIADGVKAGQTEQEARQTAINAISYEAGVSPDAIEALLRGMQ
jgi:hypothetical protein